MRPPDSRSDAPAPGRTGRGSRSTAGRARRLLRSTRTQRQPRPRMRGALARPLGASSRSRIPPRLSPRMAYRPVRVRLRLLSRARGDVRQNRLRTGRPSATETEAAPMPRWRRSPNDPRDRDAGSLPVARVRAARRRAAVSPVTARRAARVADARSARGRRSALQHDRRCARADASTRDRPARTRDHA